MEDPHNPLYQKLVDLGFSQIEIDDTEIRCNCTITNHCISLTCKLSDSFPYELPTVYISEESYALVAPLPHVNSDLSICTFDRTICIPNFLFPEQVVLDSFCQARSTINEGIAKDNCQEFFDEIDAYWQIDCTDFAKSIVSTTESVKTVKLYWDNTIYLADSKNELDLFLANNGIKKRFQRYYFDCIYLPLAIKLYPPFPKSNIELYNLLRSDSTVFEPYRMFAQKYLAKGCFVLTSTPNSGARCLQLWRQSPATTNVPGFRKGHVPAHLAYLFDEQKKPIIKLAVMNLSQSRLFFRGGEGLNTNISKCAVIGCGSIGSYIIEALTEYGVSQFVLNDNEKLSAENIARHLCGHSYVGKSKVLAISDKLKKHNPNINTELFNENGIMFVNHHQGVLNNCDCIIMATAYTPLEYKLVEMLNSSEITKPIVLVWVEPHLAAGHAMILQKPQDVFSEFFDSNYMFKHSVIKNSCDFTKKESGCQSTFIPYSAFHLKRFIYTFLEYLLQNVFTKKKQGNYLLTWCGDLSSIRKLGGIIKDRWTDAENYSMHITRID